MSTPQPTSIRPPRLSEAETRINPYLPILEKHRRALREQGFPDVGRRVAALEALARAIGAHADELVQAVQADFGHRSPHETQASEVLGALAEIRLTKGKTKGWAKPKPPALLRATGWTHLLPAQGYGRHHGGLELSRDAGAFPADRGDQCRQPRHDQADGHDAA